MSGKIDRARIKLQTTFERELQKRIKDLGLYSSGALYNSIKVTCNLRNDAVNLVVDAVDYWEFIDEKYKISNYVYNLPVVETALNDLVFVWLMEELD